MKILLAGSFRYYCYEEVCARSLESMGIDVVRFSWDRYFIGLIGRIEQRFMFPLLFMRQFEHDLYAVAKIYRPDIIWIWRGQQVRPEVVRRLKHETGATLISYNHDDAFGPGYEASVTFLKPNIWKSFIKSIKEYDIHFVVRSINVLEYLQNGAKKVDILRQYFVSELHRPVVLSDHDKNLYQCDLVFVGHYEDDGRVRYLKAIVANGFSLRLFGSGWPPHAVREIFGRNIDVLPITGEEYVKALCGGKICLSFLSKLNRDTYTTRSFEIPACGKVMLSERTDELMHFFKDNAEACFFSSPEEMIRKAQWLLNNLDLRERVAQAGQRRVWVDKHDVGSRTKYLLSLVSASDKSPIQN